MAFTSVLNGMHNIAQCFFFNFLFENYLHAYKKKLFLEQTMRHCTYDFERLYVNYDLFRSV